MSSAAVEIGALRGNYLGPVVQSIVSLTKSLVEDSVSFQYSQHELWLHFFAENCEKLLHCTARASHIFLAKNVSSLHTMIEN